MQNFAFWGFSAEQFWQRIDLPETERLALLYHSLPGRGSELREQLDRGDQYS
jgi:hypothetical protein